MGGFVLDGGRGFMAPASTFDCNTDTLAIGKLLRVVNLEREYTATYVAKCRIKMEISCRYPYRNVA